MPTFTINVVVNTQGSASGTATVHRHLNSIASKTDDLQFKLYRMFRMFGIGWSVQGLVRLADSYTTLQNKLKAVTKNSGDLAVVSGQLYNIAIRTRTAWDVTAQIYSRTALATKELGLSQKATLEFTESLNQAVIIGGSNTIESSNALVQLSQALASGVLRGDEMRSVLEQLPVVADVISKHLGVTRGQLRKLGTEGKVSSKQIIEAFAAAKDELAASFAKTIPTIAQQFENLKTATMRFLGTSTIVQGVLQGLAKTLGYLSENLDQLFAMFVLVAAVVGGRLAAAAFPALISRLKEVGIAIRALFIANPFAFMLVSVLALVAAMTDLAQLGKDISDFATGKNINKTAEGRSNAREQAALKAALSGASQEEIAAAAERAVKAYDDATWAVTQLKKAQREQKEQQDLQNNGFERAANRAKEMKKALEDLAQYKEKFPGDTFMTIDNFLSPKAGGTKPAERTPEERAKTKKEFGEVLAAYDEEFEKKQKLAEVEKTLAQAVADHGISDKDRVRILKEYNQHLNADKAKKYADEMKKLREELRSLEGALNPVVAAFHELEDTQALLSRGLEKGFISEEKALELIIKKGEQLHDSLNPAETALQLVREEVELLKLTEESRKRAVELQEFENQLRAAGNTEAEIAYAKFQLDLLQDQRAEQEKINKLEEERLEKEKELTELKLKQQASLEEWLRSNDRVRAMDKYLPTEEERRLKGDPNVIAWNEGLEAFKANVRDTGALVVSTMTEAFNSVEDVIVNFVTGTKTDFYAMVTNLLELLTKLLLRMLLLQAFSSFFNPTSNVIGAKNFAFSGGGNLPGSSPGFANGGSFIVGGNGGTDTTPVMFRATRGERVDITPKGRNAPSGSAPPPEVKVMIVNSLDPSTLVQMIDSPEGHRAIANVIRVNPQLIRGILR